MKIILDEDYTRLQAVKARLHAMRLTESDEHNFRRLTASIADVDAVLLNIAERSA